MAATFPAQVAEHWAGVPCCGDINFLFKPFWFGPTVRVRCQGWGQLCNDEAATRQAFSHIMNRQRLWWARYVGWEAIGEVQDMRYMKQGGVARPDFYEQYRRYVEGWRW